MIREQGLDVSPPQSPPAYRRMTSREENVFSRLTSGTTQASEQQMGNGVISTYQGKISATRNHHRRNPWTLETVHEVDPKTVDTPTHRGAATAGGVVGGGCRDVAVLIRPDTATALAPRCNMCYIGALSFTRCCTCRSDLIEVDPQ
ncbi:Kinesin-like protein kif21b [Homalodisca vitripennis]|nr:Kinesin-like protein kif21b [Homalodisca vitripennis]